MYDTPRDLLDAYRAAPDIYRALLADITQEQAANAKGGDEGWSVVEVMCHLRDAEEREVERVRAMRAQDNPFLPGYDQDVWARERNYAAANLQDAFDAFLRFREEHIAELEALSPEDWERKGIHEDYGTIDIKAKTIHIAAHDTQHAAQIARQLREA
jgi:hypothetical protein